MPRHLLQGYKAYLAKLLARTSVRYLMIGEQIGLLRNYDSPVVAYGVGRRASLYNSSQEKSLDIYEVLASIDKRLGSGRWMRILWFGLSLCGNFEFHTKDRKRYRSVARLNFFATMLDILLISSRRKVILLPFTNIALK